MNLELEKAFSEISEILKRMPEEILRKIPNEVIEYIDNNRDKSYTPENIEKMVEEGKISDVAMVYMAYLYRDYLCSEVLKEKLKQEDDAEYKKIFMEYEKSLHEKYKTENLFQREKKENNNIENNNIENNNTEIVVIKNKWYKKIFELIKDFFAKKN